MAKVNYNTGDTIQYRTSDGSTRTAFVEAKDEDIKNGRSGFAGFEVNTKGGCWGYDDQVLRVVKN